MSELFSIIDDIALVQDPVHDNYLTKARPTTAPTMVSKVAPMLYHELHIQHHLGVSRAPISVAVSLFAAFCLKSWKWCSRMRRLCGEEWRCPNHDRRNTLL